MFKMAKIKVKENFINIKRKATDYIHGNPRL